MKMGEGNVDASKGCMRVSVHIQYPTHLIENKHVTFADIGDSFLHQVNDTTRGSNNDMHCGKERWGGGGRVNKMAQLCYCVVVCKPLYDSGTLSIAETSLYRTKGCRLNLSYV